VLFQYTIMKSRNVKLILISMVVDLTGAGDLFAAGYLHAYINNLSLKQCLAKGTEMSSKVISKIGARI
jgi:sugar/nucleoside kinase (ribokinase family)